MILMHYQVIEAIAHTEAIDRIVRTDQDQAIIHIPRTTLLPQLRGAVLQHLVVHQLMSHRHHIQWDLEL